MTMTDNDDPLPLRDPPPSDGLGDEGSREKAARSRENRAIRWARSGGTGVHVAPTDPEVPSAKRRGAIRRQRSLVGLSAVVMGLLSITLMLLYRASMRVGVRDSESDLPSLQDHDFDNAAAPHDAVNEGTLGRGAPPAPMRTGDELENDDAPASNDNAPAGSASSLPRGQPPALDIIRTPAF